MLDNTHHILKIGIAILLFTGLAIACRKDNIEPDRYPDIPSGGTQVQKALDSIYMYANEVWLWQEYLPSYGEANLRGHADAGAPEAYRMALFSLLGSILDPRTGQPFEKELAGLQLKYSYIGNPTGSNGQTAALSSNGTADDMGFETGQYGNGDVRVAYVTPGSPAAMEGIRRGDRILRVNGRAVSEASVANDALAAATVELELQKQDGSLQQTTLYRTTYTSHGIYRDALIDLPDEQVGYLAFGRFTNLPEAATQMEATIGDFAARGVRTLIIDLRYNVGGYVSSVRQVANLIAPSGLDGKTMYSEHYNALMQQGKASILANQPYFDSKGEAVYIGNRRATYLDVDFSIAGNTRRFEKAGSLANIQRVYFIVSGNTASAAEMLINILKPHVPVKIAGTTTYGKPVGFFGINLAGYTLYLSSFLIRNSEGDADYSDGFVPDIPATDDLGYDFGDVRESSLAAVLDDISGQQRGHMARRTPVGSETPGRESGISISGFRGMLKDGSGLKKEIDDP